MLKASNDLVLIIIQKYSIYLHEVKLNLTAHRWVRGQRGGVRICLALGAFKCKSILLLYFIISKM